ncbi:MAG: hypothetical protein C4541_10515 [Candidatus Auribacter fodinae]|jgi:hypothetical protein|uniref:Exopolyphosphatase n=1 Tax=Candidatus Auribacter fodinae TaxID=2093366 RepID=A0A3A4QTY5_9BACT|nr:MAG: hypothetical protein C4541_10515 [Candidatus Auribacter fodinae]
MYNRIVTHNDFDGIVSAALCSLHYGVNDLFFCSPTDIPHKRFPVSNSDILCDLPYSSSCGLWFDHHIGNKEELEYRGIALDSISGKFNLSPSCARVIYDYLSDNSTFPDFMGDTVAETDIVDGFLYSSPEEWRNPTPGRIINSSLMTAFSSQQDETAYMRRLAQAIRSAPLPDIAQNEWVKVRFNQYLEEEATMLKIIEQSHYFLPQDKNREIPVIDLTEFKRQPSVVRALVFSLCPSARAVVMVSNQVQKGIKTTNLNFSISLGFHYFNKKHGKDVGAIMDELGLGDGHTGAAGGRLSCSSKPDMVKKKQQTLNDIFNLWVKQPDIMN